MVEPQGSPTTTVTHRAAREFAWLEAWLASSRILPLPLHQMESQQPTQGREVQRLLKAHLQLRGDGDVGPPLRVPQQAGGVIPIAGSVPAL